MLLLLLLLLLLCYSHHQTLEADKRLTARQRQDLAEALTPRTTNPDSDPSKRLALHEHMTGLTRDQAWFMLMAMWPGAKEEAAKRQNAQP